MKENVWKEVEHIGMSAGYKTGIPEGTEEVFRERSHGRERQLAQAECRKHYGSKILGHDRCPRKPGL